MIRKMFSFIKHQFDKLIDLSSKILIRISLKINPKQAVIMIDGGICSQIHQWRIGEALMAKGISVKYDISWFESCGKDIDGRFVRNFDLIKAFPKIKFKKASNFRVNYFKKHFPYSEVGDQLFINAELPKYFGYYYPSYNKSLLPFDYSIPISILDNKSKEVANEIKQDEFPVGIHVRRGDMSTSRHNWRVCPVEYFINAIEYFLGENSSATFYFFSDEPDWVEENIFPKLTNYKNKFKIIAHNGSDKGYMDLALLSYCKHFVASQGSFAHYANMLNHDDGKILVSPQELGEIELFIEKNKREVTPRKALS